MIKVSYHDYDPKVFSKTMMDTFDLYVIFGLLPGGFAEALICCNMTLAENRADFINRPVLTEMAEGIKSLFPEQAHGSYENFKNWIRDTDGRRSAYRAEKEIEYPMRCLKHVS